MTAFTSLKAVVLDWAGTMIDFGSRAPVAAFVDAFRAFGVEVSEAEARVPMGLAKLDHMRAILAMPRVAEAWRQVHGRDPDEAALDALFTTFRPLSNAVVGRHADLIPGAAETAAALRARGFKIGSTTGYTRENMADILPAARAQGYEPDLIVCAGDTPAGRPSPFMMYRCFLDLCVWPARACVKVDDTAPGIAEGREAGAWTVGVIASGNEVGLSQEAWRALPAGEKAERRAHARGILQGAGAHALIETVADLLPCLADIEARLARGERP